MPSVPFDTLPDDARVWVFASRRALDEPSAARLLAAVDEYLAEWSAHGMPLTCARQWRDGRFLAIGVDQRAAGASGCSIDALYRLLQHLERSLDTTLVAGGLVFFRDRAGSVQCADRASYPGLVRAGTVTGETPVFDTTITSAGEYRSRFERAASASWHAQLA